MKHRVAGRKLGRRSSHRLALLRNLATALFDRERIQTTLMKAKEVRPFAEKLVTLSKRDSLHARRRVLRHIHDRDVVAKLFDTLSARYSQRPGGYTRIIKLGPRRGDGAEEAILELVGSEGTGRKKAAEPAKETKAKASRGPAKAAGEAAAAEGKTRTPRRKRGTTATDAEKPKPERKTRASKDAAAAKPAAPRKTGRKTPRSTGD